MLALAVVVALLVPALSYAGLIYLLDLHEREPTWALVLGFVLGAAGAPAALAAERSLLGLLPQIAPDLSELATLTWSCFGVIGPVEELTKLLITLVFARRTLMNEPVDGVVYAGMVSLGFSVGEGFLGARGLSGWALLLRAVFPLPAHLFFSALWGAGLGALRYWGNRFLPLLMVAFVVAALCHGAYDYLLFAWGGIQRGAVVALLASAGVLCALSFRALLSASPFREVTPRPGLCPMCTHPYPARVRFCAGCSELLAPPVLHLPLSLAATLSAFIAQGATLLAGVLLSASWRGQSAAALWRASLSWSWADAALLSFWLGLGALAAGALSARHPSARMLDVLVGCALSWLCTVLYLTLIAPQHVLRALAVLPLSLLVATVAQKSARASATHLRVR